VGAVFAIFLRTEPPKISTTQKRKKKLRGKNRHGILLIFLVKHFRHVFFPQKVFGGVF
jgi:hypothetical protein